MSYCETHALAVGYSAPLLQDIAESWPDALDDTAARSEWGWRPQYGLDAMTDIMLDEIAKRIGKNA